MSRTLPLLAALIVTVLAVVAGPALSAKPYRPDPVDFELAAPAAEPTAASGDREYVSPPLRAPKRFNLVGFRWRGSGDHAHLRVRVKRDGGAWTKWQELEADTADGPDAGRGEPVRQGMSAPAWAGQADWIQYRSERRLPGARLHFVNTTGTATAADRRLTAFRRTVNGGVVAVLKPPSAHAAESQPGMVSRAGWGAQSCPPRSGPDYGQVKMAFIHHTVNLNDYSREEAPSVVLGICRYHRNSNGWNDIGYNFLVDKYGTIYEGRAGGVDQPIVGAQAQGFNSVSTGIANIGTFEDVPQSDEALNAMSKLIRWKLPLHGAPTSGNVTVTSAGGDTNRFGAGAQVTMNRVSGHRDGNNTACPGSALYAQLPELRRRVGNVQPTSPGTTNGVAQTATRLVATPPTVIGYPQLARVAGNLSDFGGGGESGLPVQLQRQTTSGSFKTIVRGTTGDGGSFALQFNPSKRAVVRVRFPGDASHGASESRPATINVRPQLSWTRPASRMAPGRIVSVPGAIAPRKPVVRLVVERRSGKGRKGRIASVAAKASSGKYKARIRLKTAGLYRMYVVFAGDKKNLTVSSKKFYVRVKKGGGGTAAPAPEATTPTPPPTGDGGGTAATRR
jgi:hypothetical protein